MTAFWSSALKLAVPRPENRIVVFYGSDLEINLLQCQKRVRRSGLVPSLQQGTTMRDRSGVLRAQFS